MPEFTPDEARRYMAALRRKRAVAIDEADHDAIADLDVQIADVSQWLQRVSRQEHREPQRPPAANLLRKTIVAGLLLFVIAIFWNGSQPQPQRESSTPVPHYPAGRRAAPEMPTAIQIEVAAALELESRAADPDAIDVRTCGAVGGVPTTPPSPSSPWRVRCEFAGANAFGGRVIQSATFDYSGEGMARFVAMD